MGCGGGSEEQINLNTIDQATLEKVYHSITKILMEEFGNDIKEQTKQAIKDLNEVLGSIELSQAEEETILQNVLRVEARELVVATIRRLNELGYVVKKDDGVRVEA